jgi:ketosteroid isomerase-like protein
VTGGYLDQAELQEALGSGVKNPRSLAFGHSLNRISGTLKNGDRTDFWLLWTTCFRQIDDNWLIAHDQPA